MDRHRQGTKLFDHATRIARFGRGNDRKQHNHQTPTYRLVHAHNLSLAMHHGIAGKSAQPQLG
jgi:hypothetical protein